MLANTELTYQAENIGSDCTNSQQQQTERRSGMTATRQPTETGQQLNQMRLLHAFVTRQMDSKTGAVPTHITSLARSLPVTHSQLFT